MDTHEALFCFSLTGRKNCTTKQGASREKTGTNPKRDAKQGKNLINVRVARKILGLLLDRTHKGKRTCSRDSKKKEKNSNISQHNINRSTRYIYSYGQKVPCLHRVAEALSRTQQTKNKKTTKTFPIPLKSRGQHRRTSSSWSIPLTMSFSQTQTHEKNGRRRK